MKRKIKNGELEFSATRKYDCIFYEDCLSVAAYRGDRRMKCFSCKKYEKQPVAVMGVVSNPNYKVDANFNFSIG